MAVRRFPLLSSLLWRRLHRPCVLVTGCDSGIGLSLAKHLAESGCEVFAGVRDLGGRGAAELSQAGGRLVRLDVTDSARVRACQEEVRDAIRTNHLELAAVVNNAGVMVFGEFEWQTDEQIAEQLNVNILGYMTVAKAFLPLLRKHNGRLINVSSHCSTTPLPCLAVYSATKAAVEAWSSALALEMHKFNVPVITIHPGSYVRESEILSAQSGRAGEMWEAMSDELRATSGDLFKPVMEYMSAVASPAPITDPALHSLLSTAIFSRWPRFRYINQPWRYALYYRLIALARPFSALRRKLILSFISLPKYK